MSPDTRIAEAVALAETAPACKQDRTEEERAIAYLLAAISRREAENTELRAQLAIAERQNAELDAKLAARDRLIDDNDMAVVA